LALTGLVLAGANEVPEGASPANDAILNGREIVENADLGQTDLVVLSACETALGEQNTAGEGAMGLAKAFEVAGAGSVIGALWRVPSRETTDLFERFYGRVLGASKDRKVDYLAALRQSQLESLESLKRQGLFHSSFFWAAFVSYGR